jgi:transcriptional regulator with XRE-family HTH domain
VSFGIRLREERDRLHITQQDAALLVGLTHTMWSRYERGVAKPNADVLLGLAGHGFDVNYVLGGSRTASENNLVEPEERLVFDYRSTDDEGRAQISRTARIEAQRVASAAPKAAFTTGTGAPALTLAEDPPKGALAPKPRKP